MLHPRPPSGRSNIRLARKGPEPGVAVRRAMARKRRPTGPPFHAIRIFLLTAMPPAVLAAEPGPGRADNPVLATIGCAADWRGRDCRRRADGAADHAGCDIARPEAGVAVIPP